MKESDVFPETEAPSKSESLIETEAKDLFQSFRPIYRNSNATVEFQQDVNEVVQINTRLDPELERPVIFWKDIQEAFQDALYIQNKFNVIQFIKDCDNRSSREPLRISIVPDIVLDVFIENPVEQGNLSTIIENLDVLEINTSKGAAIRDKGKELSYISTTDIQNSVIDHKSNNSPTTNNLPILHYTDNTRGLGLTFEKALNGDIQSQFDVGAVFELIHQDYVKAMQWYLVAAKQGHARSQHRVGLLYEFGWGVTKNVSKARDWYLKAADQNDPVAQNVLGILYHEGTGFVTDYGKAMEWYLKAAEQGYSNAHRNIGILYRDGLGVDSDPMKAMEWYRKAADLGNSLALNSIGTLYHEGRGVGQNFSKALEWYLKASSQGVHYAQKNIADLCFRGNVGNGKMSVIKWYLRSAKEGNIAAQFDVGERYFNGTFGVTQDYTIAKEWFQRAASQGHSKSQYYLAVIYNDGRGVPQRHLEALKWFELSADQGDVNSRFALATLYLHEQGVPVDYFKVKELYHGIQQSRFYFSEAKMRLKAALAKEKKHVYT